MSLSALPAYEIDKCIFCQLDKNEKLHALGTNKKLEETRESELKQGLQDTTRVSTITSCNSDTLWMRLW